MFVPFLCFPIGWCSFISSKNFIMAQYTPLSENEREVLFQVLKTRFAKYQLRHAGIIWTEIQNKLESSPGKLWSLQQMEATGGEPDVVGRDEESGEFIFMDCAPESPKGRRSICYDPAALESRKEYKPAHSAVGMAEDMGIQVLNESQYRYLQQFGPFDAKTSSWLATPTEIRKLGGAIFGDWRYGQVFIYHNGAESYYAARGFRGILRV
jgi:hypothetical protein